MLPRDVLHEATVQVRARPLRTFFTVIGLVVATAGLVLTVSLVATNERDLRQALQGLFTTELEVQLTTGNLAVSDGSWIAREAERARSAGARNATITWSLHPEATVLVHPGHQTTAEVDLIAVGGDLPELDITGAPLELRADLAAAAPVWVGRGLVDKLDLTIGDSMWIEDQRWTVAGIVEESESRPAWLLAVLTDGHLAFDRFAAPSVVMVTVEVLPGEAPAVADRLAASLDPLEPRNATVLAPVDAGALAEEIDERVVGAGIGITIASVLIGVVFIGVTAFAAVLERQPELALRRALGGSRRWVASTILLENILIGGAGGGIGACAGSALAAIVSLTRSTSAAIPLWVLAAAVGCGLLMGLLGGAVPTIWALRVQPIRFLREL